jgi:hypothetical protein
MVLATMIERNLHLSITLYGDFFLLKRPVALGLLVFIVVTTALPFIRRRRERSARAAAQGGSL